jgi:hypothetical protein
LGFILLFLLVKPLGFKKEASPPGRDVRFFRTVAGKAIAKQWVGEIQEGEKLTVS